jgi:polyketide biosynthesis enoyl-CoA hydratase PksI
MAMTYSVVRLRQVDSGIMELAMHDRVHKNTFSRELICELIEAFAQIEADADCRVVVLTGYDCYFACGATQEGLLDLHEGRMRFTDTNFYSLPLACRVPVIAAMQGHGIGGGFVLGVFCDFVILSRESVYSTNFMNYGFTPGMGATSILPRKLGLGLAQEMLLGGRSYRGAELEKRGIAFPVLPRSQVLDYALELAREIAEKPKLSLVMLKDHLLAEVRAELPRVVQQEIVMHEQTCHRPEVKERIDRLFKP